jgi:L-fuculose-phosphate aldolase
MAKFGKELVERDLDRIASTETIVHRTIYKHTSSLAIIHVNPAFAVIESMLVDTKSIVRG